MKLLTQSGVGRQVAQISQVTKKIQFGTVAVSFVALVLVVMSMGLIGCAGLTGAASTVNHQDPKVAVLIAGSSPLTFGNVPVGTISSQSLTIANTGTAAADIGQTTISGTGFTVVGAVPSGSIPVGQAITVQVQFQPQSVGAATGTLALASNASNSPISVPLNGSGTQPGLTASPMTLSFGGVDVGAGSSKNITLTNSGGTSITVSGITPTGSGVTTSGISLPATLATGASTTFTVQFAPAAAGNVSGTISIASNAPASPITVQVTGTGTQAEIAASPASINFGSVVDGNTNTQPIQISNPGNAPLTISQVTVTGGPNGFGATGLSVPLVIQAGKSASLNAAFGPSATGSFSGSVSIVSNAPNSPLTINMTGSGAVATRTLSASTMNVGFGNVNEGTTTSQNVIITNTGNANVTISGVSASGTGFGASGINSGVVLAPNQAANLSVSFNPTSAGAANGSATVTSNASNSSLSISLSGTGVQVTQHSVALAWTASTTSGVVGYYVYRGTESGNYTKISSSVTTTSFTDSTVQSGQDITYYYVVTAVDASGTESTDSNQATVSVP